MGSTVNFEINNHQVTITLDRAEKRNAFDQDMIAELTEAFKKAKAQASARLLVLKGSGQSFSAGADLNWMRSMVDYSLEENIKDSHLLRNMFQALMDIPYPVIGHVQGHVMGGALGLVSGCDIVAAVSGTKFCFSEVKLGLSPAVVSEYVSRKISRSALTRLFLTAEVFEAEDAHEMGLVHFVGKSANVDQFLAATSSKILKNGPEALRATKALLKCLYPNVENFADISTTLISQLRVSPEGQEGLTAFFDKRSPTWTEG